MRTQQHIWEQEHASGNDIPSETAANADYKPSGAVVDFFDWLASQGTKVGTVLDIGCGKGRNTFYAAQRGFVVTAMDYIPSALAFLQNKVSETDFAGSVTTLEHSMDRHWPFSDAIFDVIIDNFASIDVETAEGRQIIRDEMLRTMKPGAYALVHVVSAEDELEAEMIQQNPGPEPHSCYWPSGKFQKNYTEAELRQTFSDFYILHMETVSKKAHKRNQEYPAQNIRLFLQKKVI